MDGRCATCKHWETNGADDPPFGYCLVVGCRWKHVDPNPESLAYTDCRNEGISGELLTHPDFGCVQWEKADG